MPFYLIFLCLFLGLLIGRSAPVRLQGKSYITRVIQLSFCALLFTMGYALRQRSGIWEKGGSMVLLAFVCAIASGLGSVLLCWLIARVVSLYEQ